VKREIAETPLEGIPAIFKFFLFVSFDPAFAKASAGRQGVYS
jgi:hypothetical protein